MKKDRGITLIALVVTIIILLILATVSINLIWNDNGILERAKSAVEEQNRSTVKEKIKLILGDYAIEFATGTKTLIEYLNEKKEKGEIEEVTNNGDGTITVGVDGYEVTIKEEDLSIVSTEKTVGIRPKFEVKTTKTAGTTLTGDETEKAITIDITNIAEFGDNYIIEVKDKDGNIITKQTDIIAGMTGQASYIINKSGNYTITVIGIKDEKTKKVTKIEEIKFSISTIEESNMFSKENGVIDIVWLDINNNVISNPISPENYLGGLTPVKYSENEKKWIETDKSNKNNEWYNYVAQTGNIDGKTSNWANAVANYAELDKEKAYFVWIPRYAYKITYFSTEEEVRAYRENGSLDGIVGYSNIKGIVKVENGEEKLLKDSKPTNVKGIVQNSQYADYIPHPAFEFDEAKAGIWVGKFESSGNTSKITIIPGKVSLKDTKVGDIFKACQGVMNTYNLIGDSHMMKNTEWGAVAYLTESKYGRNGTEVTISGSNYTGGDYYFLKESQLQIQSTTGNIYGIYDMNGTAWEYVAAVLDSKLKNDTNGNYYDFTTIDSKYYNMYTNYNESKKIKGDGVYETSIQVGTELKGIWSWYQHSSRFVDSSEPVLLRSR